MVILNKIYTKTGDDGTTGLGSGSRRKKFDLRVTSYGTVDETNASIGVARLYSKDDVIDKVLATIQNDLFDLGADLSVPEDRKQENQNEQNPAPLRITERQVTRLEEYIDQYNCELEPLRSFVLSGGSELAAYLHLARTISRRAERHMVELSQQANEIVNPAALIYVNRLSDLLFVLARYANDQGKADVLWQPGKNR